jgi:hypothetical protein
MRELAGSVGHNSDAYFARHDFDEKSMCKVLSNSSIHTFFGLMNDTM